MQFMQSVIIFSCSPPLIPNRITAAPVPPLQRSGWVVCKLRRKSWQLYPAQLISRLPTSSGRKALPTPSLKKGDHPLPPP